MNATAPTCGPAVAAPVRSKVLDALSRHRAPHARRHGVDREREPVLRRVLACRTSALGAHLRVCGGCGWEGIAYNSCRNRHCPQCQGREAADWAEARSARMLPSPHFQVVFTLPAELRPVAHGNQALVYELLFRVAASVLQDLAAQRMGGRLGVTAVLHTWTADLGYHPHVHCIVTAGALRHDAARWVASRPDFLFSGRVMGAMFRGRLLEALIDALDGDLLALPSGETERSVRQTVSRLAKKHRRRWVVHVEPPRGRPVEHITRYLARYVKRVAISDARIVAVTATHVVIRGRHGPVELDGAEFVRRFLLHVLPRGLRKVRHYGLYAPGGAGRSLERARALLGGVAAERGEVAPAHADGDGDDAPADLEVCPACRAASVRRVHPEPTPAGMLRALRAFRSVARGPP